MIKILLIFIQLCTVVVAHSHGKQHSRSWTENEQKCAFECFFSCFFFVMVFSKLLKSKIKILMNQSWNIKKIYFLDYFQVMCSQKWAKSHNPNPWNCSFILEILWETKFQLEIFTSEKIFYSSLFGHQFVQCDESGRFFVMDCAPGTAWSELANTCDHERNVRSIWSDWSIWCFKIFIYFNRKLIFISTIVRFNYHTRN